MLASRRSRPDRDQVGFRVQKGTWKLGGWARGEEAEAQVGRAQGKSGGIGDPVVSGMARPGGGSQLVPPHTSQSLSCEQRGGVLSRLPSDHIFLLPVCHQTDTHNVPVYLSTRVAGTGNHWSSGPRDRCHQLLNKHAGRSSGGRRRVDTCFPCLSCWVLRAGRRPSLRPALAGGGGSSGACPPGCCERLGAWP